MNVITGTVIALTSDQVEFINTETNQTFIKTVPVVVLSNGLRVRIYEKIAHKYGLTPYPTWSIGQKFSEEIYQIKGQTYGLV